MSCPRCETGTLVEREREGIVVDVCSTCRGIWLDRGELEKIVARATRDIEELEAHRAPPQPQRAHRYDDDDDYRHHRKRKRGLLESLGDIFD